jgi:hypothetical protein
MGIEKPAPEQKNLLKAPPGKFVLVRTEIGGNYGSTIIQTLDTKESAYLLADEKNKEEYLDGEICFGYYVYDDQGRERRSPLMLADCPGKKRD